MRRWIPLLLVAVACLHCDAYDQLVLRPSDFIRRRPTDLGFQFDELKVPTREGRQISVWHIYASTPPRKGIIVVIPGNDANKSRYVTAAPLFADNGWDLVLPDYLGFGESDGEPSLEGLIESAYAAFDYAFSQDPTVVGLGISVGTPVLTRVAVDYDLAAAIFDSSMLLHEAASLFAENLEIPIPLVNLADAVSVLSSPEAYDSKRWIAQVRCPKLFLHSPDDSVTPFQGAWELFELAPQPKHFFVTQGQHALQAFVAPNLYRSVVNGYLDGIMNRDPIENELFLQILQDEFNTTFESLGLEPPPISDFLGEDTGF